MNSFRMIRRDGCVPQLSQGRASRCSRLAVIAILMSTTLVAAGAGGYVYARASAGQILPGVRAAGVDVGGFSPADGGRRWSPVGDHAVGVGCAGPSRRCRGPGPLDLPVCVVGDERV